MTTTPKTLTVTECHQLLDALLPKNASHKQHVRGVRNRTIALLMLDAGLRVGEVVQLHICDLVFNSDPVTSIIISPEIAKTKTERTIPVSTRLSAALKELWRCDWSNHFIYGAVFAFSHGEDLQCITTRQVERIIRKAAMESIGRPVHPHMLRHTFASKLMRKTNARIVQELLGHAQMSSTQIYTHPNEDDKKKAIESMAECPANPPGTQAGLAVSSDAANGGDTGRADHNHRQSIGT